MRKLVLLFGLIAVSIGALAQNKGDMYVLTSIHASLGKFSSYEIYNNQTTQLSQQPMNTEFGLGIGFGYFVTDGFRLELAVSGYSIQSPREKVSTVWLNNINRGITLSPNVSYYFQLADQFYYTPEVGVSFELGKYTHEESSYQSSSYPYRGFYLYANLLAFQFKVTPRFSMGVVAGDLQYGSLKYYYTGEPFYESESFRFRWNSGSIAAYFYF